MTFYRVREQPKTGMGTLILQDGFAMPQSFRANMMHYSDMAPFRLIFKGKYVFPEIFGFETYLTCQK